MHNPDAMCTAKRHDGKPCQAYAIAGGNVCRVHGGMAPQTRKRARERLAAASDWLMTELLQIAKSGESEAIRLAAVRDALDRAGFGAKHHVDVEVMQKWESSFEDVAFDVMVTDDEREAELEELRKEVERLRAINDRVHPTPAITSAPEILEGEVFDADDPWMPGPTDDQEEQRARLRRYQRRLARPRVVGAGRKAGPWPLAYRSRQVVARATTCLRRLAMTVLELLEALSDYPEEAEVRLAQQPAWPFEWGLGASRCSSTASCTCPKASSWATCPAPSPKSSGGADGCLPLPALRRHRVHAQPGPPLGHLRRLRA